MGKDDNWIRDVSVKLLYPILDKLGYTANQVTVGNFLINNLSAVLCFMQGTRLYNLLGLFFCLFGGMVDYVDGTLARRKFGGDSNLGKWLDTSLDWLFYLMLIGGISYASNNMLCGIVCLISTGYNNYIDTTRPSIRLDSFPFSPVFFIIGGAVFNQMTLCLYLMTFFSILKASLLWRGAWKKR